MGESTGQFQVENQPVTIEVMGLPGAPALRLIPYASQAGNVYEVLTTAGAKGFVVDVNGNVTVAGTLSGNQLPSINANAATLALTAAQSGSLVNLNRAAGVVVTLPAPVVGLVYYFNALVSVTSNNYEIDTDAGTTFLMGGVRIASSGTAGDFFGDGTAKVKIQMNGTTKGGLIGSAFALACVSATQWTVLPGALISGSGVAVTPFA